MSSFSISSNMYYLIIQILFMIFILIIWLSSFFEFLQTIIICIGLLFWLNFQTNQNIQGTFQFQDIKIISCQSQISILLKIIYLFQQLQILSLTMLEVLPQDLLSIFQPTHLFIQLFVQNQLPILPSSIQFISFQLGVLNFIFIIHLILCQMLQFFIQFILKISQDLIPFLFSFQLRLILIILLFIEFFLLSLQFLKQKVELFPYLIEQTISLYYLHTFNKYIDLYHLSFFLTHLKIHDEAFREQVSLGQSNYIQKSYFVAYLNQQCSLSFRIIFQR